MSLSTDMHNQSRRGYSDATLNTNELIWNAQLSQSFLKGKPLTVMLQFYDILHEMSNFSRTINAMRRSDTSYNSINSYAMLHVVYRLNVFGSREARRGMMRGMAALAEEDDNDNDNANLNANLNDDPNPNGNDDLDC